MIKLNDNGLVIGEIKQILANFNLPNCPVGEQFKEPNKHYIKDDYIYLYRLDENGNYADVKVLPYIYNSEYTNLSGKLRIDSMLYDRYTHRYLGKYLRFIRDYKHINLMSMYNCFDGDLATSKLSFDDINGNKKVFDRSDINYSIYQIPVSISKYTLALQSRLPVELCITLDNPSTGIDLKLLEKLGKLTYRKYKFNRQTYVEDLFTRYQDHQTYKEEWEECINLLKRLSGKIVMYLKVPRTITSAITLLEGLYSKGLKGAASINNIPVCPLLLSYQNNDNYLLADKLIEYLTGNAITPLSEGYDIKKLLKYITWKYQYKQQYGVWTNNTTLGVNKIILDNKLWETAYDILPFCDKSVEKVLEGGLV